jgi:AcrR family transcriptional regulator
MVENMLLAARPASVRRLRRVADRRRAILEAAARIFAEVGYERGTLQAVGEAVGLSKTALYYYVRSKEELLGRLLATVIGAIAERAGEGLDSDASAVERLSAFLRAHVEVVCGDPMGLLLARQQDVVLGEAESKAIREARRRHEESLAAILRQGAREGTFRRVDPRTISYLILGALNGIPRWLSHVAGATPESVADALYGMIVCGIRAPERLRKRPRAR